MPPKPKAKEEEVPVEEEVSEEPSNEEGERYMGGEIPRVAPREQSKD